MLKHMLGVVTVAAGIMAAGGIAQAAEVSVAVAANFAAPMKKIAQGFEADTGHKAVLSFGSTGNFYAQIKNGAPFQMLLSADDEMPLRLEKEGLGVRGTRFTYATGRLVLWSKQAGLVDDKGGILKTGRFQRVAIANPKVAPYGIAAMEVLDRLGLTKEVTPKIVQGENIAQAYKFVFTENATLGFIALSQVFTYGQISQGSGWIVPTDLHSPLRHDAILLTGGKGNPAAEALLNYLKSDKARTVIRSFGYEL